MLTDVDFITESMLNEQQLRVLQIFKVISHGKDITPLRISTGVYEISHFSLEMMSMINLKRYQDFIIGVYEDWWDEYGVCDGFPQILDRTPILKDPDRKFVISLTPIIKAEQPSEGGWRWHKWGPYIGNQKPTCEYIHDESDMDKVYAYHIYEIMEES